MPCKEHSSSNAEKPSSLPPSEHTVVAVVAGAFGAARAPANKVTSRAMGWSWPKKVLIGEMFSVCHFGC